MSIFSCDDKQDLIAYVYGEIDAAARERVEEHLARCARCAAEVLALGDVRAELGRWTPPDAELGFAIVRRSATESDRPAATVLRPATWWHTVPVWARAAAAVLVLAAAASIANLQIRSGPDGFTVSTGWLAAPVLSEPAESRPAERRVDGAASDEWRTALTALEQQLRSEIRSARQEAARPAAAPADEAMWRRVQQLIAASEQRQERELALRLTQFAVDTNLQRRADLLRITQSFGQFDEQMLRQRQMLNNVIRISGTPQQ